MDTAGNHEWDCPNNPNYNNVKKLYNRAIEEGYPEKIYWWEAIKSCAWQDIDKVLEARSVSKDNLEVVSN